MGDGGSAATIRVGRPASAPIGRFPGCRGCPYLARNEPGVCLACCTGRSGPRPGAQGRRCPVCHQDLPGDEACTNDWCGRADRWFSTVWSVGRHQGALRQVIARYKYREETGWSPVLGRLLLGFLDEHMLWFDRFDLLMPMPAYRGPGARRTWDPVARLVGIAAELGGRRWPFTSGLVIKTAETPPLTGRTRPARRACAEGPLRQALRVVDPASVAGRRVLVIDDVLTEGSTLREVARALRRTGSVEVAGLALARQPWAGGRGPAHAQPARPTCLSGQLKGCGPRSVAPSDVQ